jgi:hypothetical protein
MDLVGERDVLARWADRKSPAELLAHRAKKNARSIDGLPALEPASRPALEPAELFADI